MMGYGACMLVFFFGAITCSPPPTRDFGTLSATPVSLSRLTCKSRFKKKREKKKGKEMRNEK
jgi:hypothetical protein